MKHRLLIVDDDEAIRTQMKWSLASDYDILLAEDRASALAGFRSEQPSLTMLDLGLPPLPNSAEEGLETLREILALDANAKIVIISGQNEKTNALQAIGSGAYDFLCKPVEVDELKMLVRRCLRVVELEREYQTLQKERRLDEFEEMLGSSPQMQAVFSFIRKVAASTAPVLLLGDSGTGKEMAALAIHRRSSRKNGPFVPINCNAIPENLLESELFGHEKGAFTGAHMQRKGLIETAGGGTLFLDEIGDLPPPIQVKLLRFLQEQSFQRVGGRHEIKVDTRVVAATNLNLKQAVADGKFREDLYFRLAVVVLVLPPLKDRGDDVGLLACEFLQRYAIRNGKTGLMFTPETLRAINRHAWPGNVRELQNRVQRAVIMADSKRVTVSDLELDGLEPLPLSTLREAREEVEKELVEQALRRHGGKITGAANELGISRPTLYELMDKLGVARD
jgi:two-component system, NtrC family, response regulator